MTGIRALADWLGEPWPEDSGPPSSAQSDAGAAFLLADRLGPWAPVRAGLSAVPLEVQHCAHCDRYDGSKLWQHRSCLLVPAWEEGG